MELLKKQEISLSQVKEFVKITIDEKELDNRRAEKEKVIGNELLIHYQSFTENISNALTKDYKNSYYEIEQKGRFDEFMELLDREKQLLRVEAYNQLGFIYEKGIGVD